jgi:hypothetical protein
LGVLPVRVLAGGGLPFGISPRRELPWRETTLRVGTGRLMHGAERVLPVVSSRALIRAVRACGVRGRTVWAWNWLSGAGLSRDELTRAAHSRWVLPRICTEIRVPSLSRPERDLPGRHLAEGHLAERRLTELASVC